VLPQVLAPVLAVKLLFYLFRGWDGGEGEGSMRHRTLRFFRRLIPRAMFLKVPARLPWPAKMAAARSRPALTLHGMAGPRARADACSAELELGPVLAFHPVWTPCRRSVCGRWW
jgi:hypothetical protein